MTAEEVLVALTQMALRLGVEVRIEPFEHRIVGAPGGGLCRVDGRTLVLVDAKLALIDQVGILGQAIGALRPLEVPSTLKAYVRTGHGPVRTLIRPRPLARTRLIRRVSP
jgi:hypothetical protein